MIEILNNPADWVRVLNVLLCAVCLLLMCFPREVYWWRRQRFEVRMMLTALAGMLVATGHGSLMAVLQDQPGGPHVMTYTAALAVAAIGAVFQFRRLRHERRPRFETSSADEEGE